MWQEEDVAGFDDLIRGALEKQGNPTAEGRASIYQSSRQALERMLERSASIDEATAAAQRQRLEQAISDIEESFVAKEAATPPPAVPTKPVPAPQPELKPETEEPELMPAAVEPVVAPAPQTPAEVVPQVAPQTAAPSAKADPVVEPIKSVEIEQPIHIEPPTSEEPAVGRIEEPGTGRIEEYPESYKGNAFERRKPYAKLLLWTIIIVGIVVAGVWAVTLGPAFLQQQFDGSVPNPASKIESGSFDPSNSDEWISAFNPSEDGHNIVSAERGQADLIRSGETMFVRLASSTGNKQNNLRIIIPKGVMQSLKGKSATFELMIKNAGETAHQFAIFCEFSALGNCGRKRFTANSNIEAFIFDAIINDADLPEGQDAFLDINSDLSNGGKPIDVYSVKVRAG